MNSLLILSSRPSHFIHFELLKREVILLELKEFPRFYNSLMNYFLMYLLTGNEKFKQCPKTSKAFIKKKLRREEKLFFAVLPPT